MSDAVVIIGGGLGGLSAAIRLSAAGLRVKLFEKNSTPGGKMGELRREGYRFDTGPSLLTMPAVLDDLFSSAGENLTDHLSLEIPEPLTRYHFDDGSVLNASADEGRMQAEIARLMPGEIENYRRFLEYSKRIYEITSDIFLHRPVHELSSMLSYDLLKSLVKLPAIDPLRSMHDAIAGFFEDPRLIQLFDRYATYTGSDPYQAPATLNIIPYVEFGLGGFYISGGMYRLVEVLHELALANGAEIYTNRPVESILHNRSEVTGVRVNGEDITADTLLCNADAVFAANQLISGLPGWTERMNEKEPSLSGMVFLWGVNDTHPELAHHNIFFSGDYAEESRRIFREHSVPEDPTVYAAITSKSDPDHAPPGKENWFVLLNMPYLSPGQDWDHAVSAMRGAVLKKLGKHGVHLAGKIESETIMTPEDFAGRYGANRGGIYGIASNGPMAAFNRSPNRSRVLDGLYFAGGTAHPGGGIPLVLLSGMMAADLIAKRAGGSAANSGIQNTNIMKTSIHDRITE